MTTYFFQLIFGTGFLIVGELYVSQKFWLNIFFKKIGNIRGTVEGVKASPFLITTSFH